jgi:hypothetical protein
MIQIQIFWGTGIIVPDPGLRKNGKLGQKITRSSLTTNELNGHRRHHEKHGPALQFTTQYHLRAHTHQFSDTSN